jgi:hypothetical protein
MNKIAKMPTDPARAKLLQNKSTWNKKVSPFMKGLYQTRKAIPSLLDDIKNLKKLMNGYPNKFHQEKGDIKKPIPATPADKLVEITTKYNRISQYLQEQQDVLNDIVQQGKSIVSEQDSYSQSFKEKKAFIDSDILFAEASNPLSRFMTRMTTFPMGRVEDEFRLISLKKLPTIYRSVKKIRNLMDTWFGTPSASRIKKAEKLRKESYGDLVALHQSFQRDIFDAFVKSEKEKLIFSEPDIKDEKDMVNKISEIEAKFKENYANGKIPKIENSSTVSKFVDKLQKFKDLRSPTAILTSGREIIFDWRDINPERTGAIVPAKPLATPAPTPTPAVSVSVPASAPAPAPVTVPAPTSSVSAPASAPAPAPASPSPVIIMGPVPPSDAVSISTASLIVNLANNFEQKLAIAGGTVANSIINTCMALLNQLNSLMDSLELGMDVPYVNRMYNDIIDNFKKIGTDLSRFSISLDDKDEVANKKLDRLRETDRVKTYREQYDPTSQSRVGLS